MGCGGEVVGGGPFGEDVCLYRRRSADFESNHGENLLLQISVSGVARAAGGRRWLRLYFSKKKRGRFTTFVDLVFFV